MSSPLSDEQIIVTQLEDAVYPETPPFHPDTAYPEYPFPEYVADEGNPIYEAVRECFRLAGLDADNHGTAEWNPLSDLVDSGERVLLKPNFVKEEHPRDPEGWKYVLTHGSVIRAVADYARLAVGERGQVIVADAPQTDSSFTDICENVGLYDVRDFYVRVGETLELVDMRQDERVGPAGGFTTNREKLAGDPFGYTEFDLANASEFEDHGGEGDYYGAFFDTDQVNHHHSGGRHEYLIASAPLEADVVFNLPKMKTHKKAGVTLSLKNLVGINGDKNYLPHHTEGDHINDEHPDPDPTHTVFQNIVPYVRQALLTFPNVVPLLLSKTRPLWERVFGSTDEVIRSGNWWGNDTVWRMCLDLNKILFYGNPDGTFRDDESDNRKRHFSLCDGVVAGQGQGPMNPDPKEAGLLVFGTHPASLDAVTAYLMGFDPYRIPILRNAFTTHRYALTDWSIADLEVESNRSEWTGPLLEVPTKTTLDFEPHFGWVDHIEHGSESVDPSVRSQRELREE